MSQKQKLKKKIQRRFWAKVFKRPNGCWEWVAALNESGYGMFGIDGKKIDRAHRISWRLHFGKIPQKLFVCHKCDNRKCVNPQHLFLGTNYDNVQDMVQKKRNSKPPYMAGHNRIDLPAKCIVLLGKMPDYKLGIRFGVSKRTIARNRHKRNISSFAENTGNTGKFIKGMRHPRWG